MLAGLQNIDSSRVARKIFWDKDLEAGILPFIVKADLVADLCGVTRTIPWWNVLRGSVKVVGHKIVVSFCGRVWKKKGRSQAM